MPRLAEKSAGREGHQTSFLDRPVEKGLVSRILAAADPMAAADVAAVVALHQRKITTGILTELGPSFLGTFYEEVVRQSAARGYVIRKNDKVIAYIVGSLDPAAFFKSLFRRHFVSIGGILLGKSLRQPSLFFRFAQRSLANLRKENLPESLAAAVADEYETAGYGVILLKKLLDAFRESGARRVQCDVAVNTGDPAITVLHEMYQKGGYLPAGEFRVGRVRYKRYQRKLEEWA